MCKRWSVLKKLGSIALAYAFGLLLGASGILPRGSDNYYFALQEKISLPESEMESLLASGTISNDDLFVNSIRKVQDMLTTIAIPLAFPLLLFSLNVRKWLKYAKTGFISMILALISVVVIITSGFFIFRDIVPETWKVAGMLVGVYTGGTPNMASLSVALDVDPNLFLMTNTYDIIIGAITLIFFITAGPGVFRAILPPFKFLGNSSGADQAVAEAESFEDYSGMFKKIMYFIAGIGFSMLIAAVSAGLPCCSRKLVYACCNPFDHYSCYSSVAYPMDQPIEKSFQLGMYFVLYFRSHLLYGGSE
jgi:hypothetical protein